MVARLLCLGGDYAVQAEGQQTDVDLDLLPVQGNVYMLHAGAAGNMAVQIGRDGVFVVNALRDGLAERIAATIETVTQAPIRYIVSTSADLHNTAGNGSLAALGSFGATNSSAGRARRLWRTKTCCSGFRL